MLTIADNGQGFDTAAANGQSVGLLSMRERVQALGGEVHVKSARGQGTTVFARLDVVGRSIHQGEIPFP